MEVCSGGINIQSDYICNCDCVRLCVKQNQSRNNNSDLSEWRLNRMNSGIREAGGLWEKLFKSVLHFQSVRNLKTTCLKWTKTNVHYLQRDSDLWPQTFFNTKRKENLHESIRPTTQTNRSSVFAHTHFWWFLPYKVIMSITLTAAWCICLSHVHPLWPHIDVTTLPLQFLFYLLIFIHVSLNHL